MSETSADVVRRYLGNVIAAEKNFETQLKAFANESKHPPAKSAFEKCAFETKEQYERLTARLETLGGAVSGGKTLLAQFFGSGSRSGHSGHEGERRSMENVMLAFTAENSKLAIYETLATIAEAAGDPDTAALSRTIQEQEKTAAEAFWRLLPEAVLRDYQNSSGENASGATV